MPVPYKLVWVASMPRSGSMWVFNVTRALMRSAKLEVFPPTVPKSDIRMIELAHMGLRDKSPEHIWCLKIHDLLPPDTPRSRFICTVRDPRDAVYSFMRFTRCTFERALDLAPFWTEICDHFRAWPDTVRLYLDYQDINARPLEAATKIDAFLGLGCGPDAIAAAVAEFERDKVRKRADAFDGELTRRRAAGSVAITESLALNEDGTLRAFDPQTGFQSAHVSDYRDGDWRAMLTMEQKRRLDAAIGPWLARNGYDRRLDP